MTNETKSASFRAGRVSAPSGRRSSIEAAHVRMGGHRVDRGIGGCGALFVFGEPMFSVQTARLTELAVQNRLPTIYTDRPHAEIGGLICYGPSFSDLWRRAATYVDKIIKGAKPADLPVEQPTKFELVINLKTAKALGLAFPQAILLSADEVIE